MFLSIPSEQFVFLILKNNIMKKVSILLVLMFAIAAGTWAQNNLKPTKHENVTWHRIVLIKFHQGKVSRAKEILKIYGEAGDAAGLKGPQQYWLITGEYNLMDVWTLEGGPSDLEWSRSPNNIKWRAEMVKKLGSDEAVRILQDEYQSLIADRISYLSRKEI